MFGDASQTQRHCHVMLSLENGACKVQLPRKRKYHFRTYSDVFTGVELIDWHVGDR